jgi:hypothetical protein
MMSITKLINITKSVHRFQYMHFPTLIEYLIEKLAKTKNEKIWRNENHTTQQ